MKDWVPVLQTLVWPVFILIILYRFRARFDALVQAISERIKKGDPFEASASGIKLGSSAPKIPTSDDTRSTPTIAGEVTPVSAGRVSASTAVVSSDPRPTSLGAIDGPGIYLVHTSMRDRSADKGDKEYYRLSIFLEGEDEDNAQLDRVIKVVYHLHPTTFFPPDRTITDRLTNFELKTLAWGMFNLTADVYTKDQDAPLRLERYINF